MERDIESCIECYDGSESGSPVGKSKGLNIIDDFNEMYSEQLKKAQDASEGTLQLQIKTLQHWVFDLSQQNKMLVKTVEELEGEALKRIDSPYPGIKDSHPKFLDMTPLPDLGQPTSGEINNETLRRELEDTKKQLNLKSKLEAKHLKEIEELRHSMEKERKNKTASEPKMVVHRGSMTDLDCEVTTFHYELEATKLKLAESEREITHLRTKLMDTESNIRSIRSDLSNTEKNARDMRAALTAEVAEKHDQILALKREVSHLEDQLRQADMQTHFKDDIIKKLREDVKVARSKETLAEVLGITERSQSSKLKLDQLRQQLESKEQQIACLEERIKSTYSFAKDELIKKLQERDMKLEASEAAFCRVRQQLEWFTNNVLQQCQKASVSKEFETYLQTQLGELHDSLKYSDFDSGMEEECVTPDSPLSSGTDVFTCKTNLSSKTVTIFPAKSIAYSVNSQRSETKKLKSEIRDQAVEIARLEDTLDQTTEQLLTLHASSCRQYYQQDPSSMSKRLVELQKDVEEAHAKMVQSWAKLRDMSQQMSSRAMKSELEQYKICATKEHSTLTRLQTEINTLLAKLATRELQANRMTQLIESLRDHLIVVQNQLQQELNSSGQNLQSWIKTLQESLAAAQAQLLEIERAANLIKDEREEFSRTQRVEETMIRSLQQELYRIQQGRMRAFDKLCQAEKNQREDWNRLVSTVIHHHDLCKREQVASDDMKQEINQLVTSLSAKAKQLQSQEEIIIHLQQTLSETKAQNQRFHKRRSITLDTDGDDEEGYHTLAKTQQEVETLRQMVNMRDRQILEKEQKISALKKALSKTRSDVRGGRFPSRVSVAPSVCKVGEVEEYRQQTLQIQAIVSRIQMEVGSIFNEMEYRDQQLNRLIENMRKTLDSTQQELENSGTSLQESEEDKAVKFKSALTKCQKSIKYFIRKAEDILSHNDPQESSRVQLQSRIISLQAELEAAQEDLLDQLQSVDQEENLKSFTNTSTAEVKLEAELEKTKKIMLEMEGRSRSAEEQNQKLKQDLAKAQEELSRVRSLPTWKKTVVVGTSDNFKINTHHSGYQEMEQNLMLKESALTQVQEDLSELNRNLQSRDKLIETQQETIKVLQSSLKLEHEESDELRKKFTRLESQKDAVKIEYQQKIEELESTVSSLQDTRKKTDEASLRMKEGVGVLCKIMFSEMKEQYHQFYQEAIKESQNANAVRDANLELATLSGHLQQEYNRAQQKLEECYSHRNETEKKHQRALAALQIVISNLNEKLKARDDVIDSSRKEIKKLLDRATKQSDVMVKYEKKIQNLQKEIAQRDKEVSTLNVKMSELQTNTSKQQELSDIFEASKRDQNLLQKKVTELNDELIAEKEKVTKLSLELNLAVNEVQRERKLSEIHKQRIEEITDSLAHKSEEVLDLDESYGELQSKFGDSVKEVQNLKDQIKTLKQQYQKDILNTRNDSMMELENQIKELTKQLNNQKQRIAEGEKELRTVQEKLLQAAKKEAHIHQEYSQKEGEWMERIRESQAEIYKLTDVINSLTDELSGTKLEVERDKSKQTTTQQKLQETTDTIERLKSQLNEKEAITGKLHGALTHLSLKVVSNVQNLENKETLLKHCEEQISQLQSLLQEKINQEEMKNEQILNLKKELDKLHSQLDIQQKKQNQISRKESMIELLESKIEQLTVELESCKYMQKRDADCVATLLSEKAEEMAKKDEEIISLQLQLNKSLVERDKLEAELNLEHEKLLKLQECNTTLTYNLKQLEHSKNQLLIELESMKKLVGELRHELKYHNQSADLELKQQSQQIVDNAQHCISEQRQFSLSLATQLRCTKQELKAIKQENKVLVDSVKYLKTANHGLEKELRAMQGDVLDTDLTLFDLTHVPRSYEMENYRSKSNITLDEQPLMEVKLKPGKSSMHSGLSTSSKAWPLTSIEADKSEYKNWKRRIQNLAQTSAMEDSKDSVYYSSST